MYKNTDDNELEEFIQNYKTHREALKQKILNSNYDIGKTIILFEKYRLGNTDDTFIEELIPKTCEKYERLKNLFSSEVRWMWRETYHLSSILESAIEDIYDLNNENPEEDIEILKTEIKDYFLETENCFITYGK